MKKQPSSQLAKFEKNILSQSAQASIEGGFFDMFSSSFGTFNIVENPDIFFSRIEGDVFQGFVICVPTSGKISTF